MSTQFNFGPAKQQIPPFTGATSSTSGDLGLVPVPTTSNVYHYLRGDGTWNTPIVILTYGVSTYTDFINAYNAGAIIYCKATTDTSDQTLTDYPRYANLSYVNSDLSFVEFLYYKSSSHSSTGYADTVYIYKLANDSTWSTTTRATNLRKIETSGDGLSLSWNNNIVTLTTSAFTGATSLVAGTGGLVPAPAIADSDKFLKADGTWTALPTMVGATSSVAGSGGLVPAPATTDVDKFLAGDGTYKSGGLPMVILSYGNSTWTEFENAYNNNVIVYCRASSNSNPATGSQTRMAFMAYVNNATTPTEVEFQYYRSMSSHSATAMGDQVFVYKLTKTGGWSVTTRDASIKEINVASGSKLGVSWSSNKVTLSNTMTANDMPMSSSDATTVKSSIDTLNSNLNNLRTSNDTIVSNIAGVKTALTNFASAMNVGEAKLVRIVHTDSSDYSIMRPSVRYSGYLTKNENNDFSWLASGYLEKEPVIFSYYGGTQYWVAEKIALNSNIATKSTRKKITGTSSFSALNIGYAGAALDELHAVIASTSSGIHPLSSNGGPMYYAFLGKYSESYYCGYLVTYSDVSDWISLRFAYENGTFKVWIAE